MALRASWKGYLKLSLVSCPVRLYNATSSSSRIAFNYLHKDTHNRVQMKYHDQERGVVERSDLVKGYQYEKNEYVILNDEDFNKVKIESTETIDIETFVDNKAVDLIYFDAPYYLAPDGAMAEETFVVLREAMKKSGKAAVARMVISNRERVVCVNVRDKGMMLMTLRNHKDVRAAAPYFEGIASANVDTDMLALADKLIEQKSGEFKPEDFTDRYEEALVELIKAKIAGEEPVVTAAPQRGNVVNLMDALKKSVEGSKPLAKRKVRKPDTRRPASKKESA